MKTILILCGVHSLILAFFHLGFWKIFNWKVELKTASLSTRVILQIANLRLIYLFFGIAVLCFVFPDELVTTSLGRAIMLGMSFFWIGRLIEQFVFLPYNRKAVHSLSLLFLVGAILFASPFFLR